MRPVTEVLWEQRSSHFREVITTLQQTSLLISSDHISEITIHSFTWQGWKVGQFLQKLMLRVKPYSESEISRRECSTGDRSLFIYT